MKLNVVSIFDFHLEFEHIKKQNRKREIILLPVTLVLGLGKCNGSLAFVIPLCSQDNPAIPFRYGTCIRERLRSARKRKVNIDADLLSRICSEFNRVLSLGKWEKFCIQRRDSISLAWGG